MKKPKKLKPKDFERKFSENPEEAKRLRAEALSSAFMKVPQLKVEAARDLLDLGFKEIYQISGRSPETLFADILKLRSDTPASRLADFRLAVYVAETPNPEQSKLHPSCWL